MQRSTWVWCAALVILATVHPATGDVFLLQSGGRVEGELVNADEKPRTSYIISLPDGGQVTLDADVVEKVQPVPPELAEYEKVRRQYPDTVQGQLQLAEWCHTHNLNRELSAKRNMHLERVLRLDPDQPDARRMLGYRKVRDVWMTLEEEKADQGLVKRDGRWISEREADLKDSRGKQRMAEIEWVKKITRWRQWLDGRQAAEAKENFGKIKDPMAIFGLGERLTKKRDSSPAARKIYVEALGRINEPQARVPLAICAIDDPVEEVRLSCLDELKKQKDESVAAYFVGRMRDKHTSNPIINRAGVALGQIKDPGCLETLFVYLVTVHEEVVQSAGGPGSMTTSFSKNGGGGGMSMNQQPKKVRYEMKNQGVLDALKAITGQDFGFDQRAWTTWYSNQKAKGGSVVAKEGLAEK